MQESSLTMQELLIEELLIELAVKKQSLESEIQTLKDKLTSIKNVKNDLKRLGRLDLMDIEKVD